MVDVDARFHAKLVTDLNTYKETVSVGTWNAVLKYAKDLKERKLKVVFFNSTPQGGGVALMRHALIRFFHLLELDVKW